MAITLVQRVTAVAGNASLTVTAGNSFLVFMIIPSVDVDFPLPVSDSQSNHYQGASGIAWEITSSIFYTAKISASGACIVSAPLATTFEVYEYSGLLTDVTGVVLILFSGVFLPDGSILSITMHPSVSDPALVAFYGASTDSLVVGVTAPPIGPGSLFGGTPLIGPLGSVNITASTSPGVPLGATFILFVAGPDALSVNCGGASTAVVGIPYSHAFPAAGGAPPYTFAIVAGTLPGGLTLDASTGIASGIPTDEVTSSFTVEVTDSASDTADVSCSITVRSRAEVVTLLAWVSNVLDQTMPPFNLPPQYSSDPSSPPGRRINGVMDGVNDTFTLTTSGLVTEIMLFRNGLQLTEGIDYTLSGSVITFIANTPVAGDILTAAVFNE